VYENQGKFSNEPAAILTVFLFPVSCAGVPVPENFPAPEMVLLPGGTFMMGTPPDEKGRNANEGPRHEVIFTSFYIGKYEVTQREYAAVMRPHHSTIGGDNLPVDCVSWHDAVEYCNALSRLQKLYHRLSGKDIA
jgi:formylglycine-generating enzyme required for sulfatase activity